MFEDNKFNEENLSCGDDCGCNHDHGHDHSDCSHDDCDCECGCHEDCDYVDLVDEDGNSFSCEIIDNFEFKGKEYLLVEHPELKELYMFRLEEKGQEVDLVVPDDEEFEEVSAYYDSMIDDLEE